MAAPIAALLGCAALARSAVQSPWAAQLCDLNGDWSVTAKKVVVVNGSQSLEHIEFFQQPGNRSFTMRTTDWKAAISFGTVSSANTVDINMVGGGMQRWYIESPGCSQLSTSSGGASVWCRFPHCPFPEPKSWPAWSPGVPAPPPPPPGPPPPAPEVRTTCGGGAPHWNLLPCHSFDHTNLKSPCAEQGMAGAATALPAPTLPGRRLGH